MRSAEHLELALDRFAQFFIAPLISEDGVEREVKAVDSEHGKNLNSDVWRQMQLRKATTGRRDHPFAKFATGSYETLMSGPEAQGLSAHAAVRTFYEQHYSANLMRLVVVGRQSLDELERLVAEKFSAVPNRQLSALHPPDDPVSELRGGQLVRLVPESDRHVVELQWAVPPEQRLYREAPAAYLSHLLGHEGTGSLFARLKAAGWAAALWAGESHLSFSTRSFFVVNVELTDEGNRRLKDVLEVVFAYIALLKGPGGVSQQIFEENRQLARLRFDFRDKPPPMQLAEALASSMQTHDDRHILSALYNVADRFDETAIRSVLRELAPGACRIMWASKTHEGHVAEREPIYSTQYSCEEVPADWLAAWEAAAEPALHLPSHNPFIPTDFDLLQDVSDAEAAAPALIREEPLLTLWYRPDKGFRTPKAVVFVDVESPAAYASPEGSVLTRLFAKLLSDYLNELAYPADLAGLQYGVSNTTTGFRITVSGYSHKLLTLLNAVLERIVGFEVLDDRFEVQREAAAREYANLRLQQPYERALYDQEMALQTRRWHVAEYEAVVADLTPDHLRAAFRAMMLRCRAVAFVTGNIPRSVATEVGDAVLGALNRLGARPMFPSQRAVKAVVKLQRGRAVLLSEPGPNPANENSAVAVDFQVGPDEVRGNALVEALAQLARRAAFYQLRTVEQLGYIVFLSAWSNELVRSLVLIVQSNAHDAPYLERRVEAFLHTWRHELEAMTDEDFSKQLEELVKSKLEKPKALRQLASRQWAEIERGTLLFDRQEREAAALRTLTKQDVVDFFQETVVDVSRRRKLAVHVLGGASRAVAEEAANGAASSATCHGAAPAAAEADRANANASGAGNHEQQDGEPAVEDGVHGDAGDDRGEVVDQGDDVGQDGLAGDAGTQDADVSGTSHAEATADGVLPAADGVADDKVANDTSAHDAPGQRDPENLDAAMTAAVKLRVDDVWDFKRKQATWHSLL